MFLWSILGNNIYVFIYYLFSYLSTACLPTHSCYNSYLPTHPPTVQLNHWSTTYLTKLETSSLVNSPLLEVWVATAAIRSFSCSLLNTRLTTSSTEPVMSDDCVTMRVLPAFSLFSADLKKYRNIWKYEGVEFRERNKWHCIHYIIYIYSAEEDHLHEVALTAIKIANNPHLLPYPL